MHGLQKMWPHFVVISSTNGPMQTGQLNVGSGGGGGGGGTMLVCTGKLLPFSITPSLRLSEITYDSQLIIGWFDGTLWRLFRWLAAFLLEDSWSMLTALLLIRFLLELFLASAKALGEHKTTSSSNDSTSIGTTCGATGWTCGAGGAWLDVPTSLKVSESGTLRSTSNTIFLRCELRPAPLGGTTLETLALMLQTI